MSGLLYFILGFASGVALCLVIIAMGSLIDHFAANEPRK